MPHPPRKFGYISAPIQFERWCSQYLEASLRYGAAYNNDARRMWARRATQHIMRRFLPYPTPNGASDE